MTDETTTEEPGLELPKTDAGRPDAMKIWSSIRQRRGPQAATEEAVSPDSAPEATDTSEQPDIEQERAELPESLTGEETDEQLIQQGYKSPASHNRIRNLARERNAAKEEAMRAQAEKEALQKQLLEYQATQAANPQKPQQLSQDDWKFDESGWEAENPAPDENDYDALMLWKAEKRAAKSAHETAVKQLTKFAHAIAPQLADIRQADARKKYEEDWSSLNNRLDAFGTSREEIEPAVLEIIRRNPQLSVKAASFAAMEHYGILDNARPESTHPTPPSVSVPGQGRATAPGSAPEKKDGPPTLAEQREAVIQQMAKAEGSGQVAATRFRSNLLGSIRKRQA